MKNLWIPLIQKPGTHFLAFIMIVTAEARLEDSSRVSQLTPPGVWGVSPQVLLHDSCTSLGLHSNAVSSKNFV